MCEYFQSIKNNTFSYFFVERSFTVNINPTGLSPGHHFAEVCFNYIVFEYIITVPEGSKILEKYVGILNVPEVLEKFLEVPLKLKMNKRPGKSLKIFERIFERLSKSSATSYPGYLLLGGASPWHP